MKVGKYANWLVIDAGGIKLCIIRHSDGPVDPLSDLNACAEFEKTLDATQCVEYVRHLDEMHETSTLTKIWAATTKGDQNELYYEAFALVTATAEQRCRAFVATMEQGISEYSEPFKAVTPAPQNTSI